MLKKVVILILLVIFIIIIWLLADTGHKLSADKLNGDIILSHNLNVYTNKDDDGIIMYTPSENKFIKLVKGNFFDINGMEFNREKTRILGVKAKYEDIGKEPFIFEFDIRNRTLSTIIQNKEIKSKGGKSSLMYRPESNDISFLADDCVYVLDKSTKNYTPIVKNVFEKYSWNSSGDKIVYGDIEDKIYIYDLKSKKSTEILEGRYPVYSNNSKLIAYQGKDYKLTVYNADTKEEWKSVDLSGHQEYIFSPDDNYIALATQYSDISNNPHFEMYVVDYKNNRKTRLFKGEGGIPAFDWK